MITGKDLRKEIETIDTLIKTLLEEGKEKNDLVNAGILKLFTLNLKLLANVRSNQVRLMKNQGIELRNSTNEEEGE